MGQSKRYRIRNRITGEWFDTHADSAQEACLKASWLIGDCWVREATRTGYGGWRNVTPRDGEEKARRP